MNLDTVSHFFQSYGIHPLIAGFIIGVLFCLVIRFSKGSATVIKADVATSPRVAFDHVSLSMNVNGQPVEIPPDVLAQIKDHIRQGHQIEAIKLLRHATNLDLMHSKLCVEAMQKSLG